MFEAIVTFCKLISWCSSIFDFLAIYWTLKNLFKPSGRILKLKFLQKNFLFFSEIFSLFNTTKLSIIFYRLYVI